MAAPEDRPPVEPAVAAATATPGKVRLTPLDGMRAVFLAVVMAHHLVFADAVYAEGWAKGAWAALDGFFVLSGFLIGGLLFSEQARTGTVRYGTFLARRVLRLYPAMLVAVAAMVAVSMRLDHLSWERLFPTVRSGVLYLMNRPFGRHDIDLFGQGTGGPVPEYSHLWSLAVEFQFYLVLPLVLWVLFKLRTRPATWAATIGVIMGLAWWNRTRVWAGQPFPAAYVFTETRIDTLLWGVLLALALRRGWIGERHRLLLRVLAGPALAWTIWVGWTLEPRRAFVYDWAMTISGFTASLLLAWVLVDSRTLVARFLGSSPMVWLGQRSYSMYLYHYPVYWWASRHLHELGPRARLPLAVAITIVLSDVSFRLVERPTFKLKDRLGGTRRAEQRDAPARAEPEPA